MLCTIAFVTLGVTLAFSANSGVPYISNEGYSSELSAQIGETIRIVCPVDADEGTIMFSWWKNGETITDGTWPRYKERDGGKILKITMIEASDGGEYECKGTSGFGSMNGRVTFTLRIYDVNDTSPIDINRPIEERPAFMNDPPGESDVTAVEGSTVKLRCLPASDTDPSIIWYYSNTRYSQDPASFTLRLHDVSPEQSGSYTCVLTNSRGVFVQFTYKVEISSLPNSEVLPSIGAPLHTVVNYGATASLQCRVRSAFQPVIEWLKLVENQSALSRNTPVIVYQDKVYTRVSNNTQGILTETNSYLNKLVIPNARPSDSGVYVCRASTLRDNFNTSEARLTVRPAVTLDPLGGFSETQAESSWEYIFGSPSATLAVIIAIPVVIILLLTIGIIYCLNKRKRAASRRRQPIHSIVRSDREAAVPLNINTNNACYSTKYPGYRPSDQYSSGGDSNSNGKPPLYQSPNAAPQHFTAYSQSDGSYRSQLHYPLTAPSLPTPVAYPAAPPEPIRDDESHFSSVSHSKPQYMNGSGAGYVYNERYSGAFDRDPQDGSTNRMHRCPPAPPGSYYSGQW